MDWSRRPGKVPLGSLSSRTRRKPRPVGTTAVVAGVWDPGSWSEWGRCRARNGFFRAPKGHQYRHTTPTLSKAEVLPARYFQPIHGSTRMIEVNLETMDEREVA